MSTSTSMSKFFSVWMDTNSNFDQFTYDSFLNNSTACLTYIHMY